MARFVVGYIDFYSNNLTLSTVEAKDWREALSVIDLDFDSNTIEGMKQEAFDADCIFEVIEI